MEITKVNLKRVNSSYNHNLLAVASIELDNCLIIHDLALMQGRERRLVRFPNKQRKYIQLNLDNSGYERNVGFMDIVHPSNNEFRQYVEETLFKIYDEENESIKE